MSDEEALREDPWFGWSTLVGRDQESRGKSLIGEYTWQEGGDETHAAVSGETPEHVPGLNVYEQCSQPRQALVAPAESS